MRDSIVGKIIDESRGGITSEAQTLYVLAEIRKIIVDHDNNNKRYPTLSFICDWVLHAKLDRKGAKSMLDNVYLYFAGLDLYPGLKKNSSFYPFLMLIFFRKEMELFFKDNDIPLEMIKVDKKWEDFLFFVLSIIEDSPLCSKNSRITILKFHRGHINDKVECRVEFLKGKPINITSNSKKDFIEYNRK